MAKEFRATICIRGVNPYILVGASRARAIRPDWRRPMPVLMRINGKPEKPFRTNMMPVGDGSFYLYLHGEIRRVSGTAVGDRVGADVEFDMKYRGGPQNSLPAWFRRELVGDPQAMNNWKALIPSRKKEVLRYFARLKTPEARARNATRMLAALSGSPAWTLGRAWKDGS
jgi:hypothetical protein